MKLSHKNPTQILISKISFATVVVGLMSAMAVKADLVFDNMSNAENGVAGAGLTASGSTPNTFMGDGYTLAAGTTEITGFDLFPYNNSGTSFTGLKLNIFVWGTVNTGAVSAATPAFGNLLASYSFTDTGAFTTGFFYSYEGSPAGSTPGITLATPLAISSTTIGLTFNYQGTTDGVNFANINSLTSVISYGTVPTVGSLTLGGATGGYYRNANSEVNGNFTSGLRTLAVTNQGLAVRVYGNVTPVPEPTTLALLGGGAMLLLFRRRA